MNHIEGIWKRETLWIPNQELDMHFRNISQSFSIQISKFWDGGTRGIVNKITYWANYPGAFQEKLGCKVLTVAISKHTHILLTSLF